MLELFRLDVWQMEDIKSLELIRFVKVDLIDQGKMPIIEKDVGDLIAKAVKDNRLRSTTDLNEAVYKSDLSMIWVGTPSQGNGSLDLKYVRRVCANIGEALKIKDVFHVVVVHSTMLPENPTTRIQNCVCKVLKSQIDSS